MPQRSYIFYVLFTGIPWKAAPYCFGSSSTLHRYFQKWTNEDVFSQHWIHALIEYDEDKGLCWKWRSIDSSIVKDPLGGEETGANPTDRGKKGTLSGDKGYDSRKIRKLIERSGLKHNAAYICIKALEI